MRSSFLLKNKDRENAILIGGEASTDKSLKRRYRYKTDDQLRKIGRCMVEDYKLGRNVLAFKYGLPLDLVRSIFSGRKKYGLYIGKPYRVAEAVDIIYREEGLSLWQKKNLKESLYTISIGGQIYVEDDAVKSAIGGIIRDEAPADNKEVVAELERLGYYNVIGSARIKPTVWKDVNVFSYDGLQILKESIWLGEFDGYRSLPSPDKHKVIEYAKRNADGWFSIGNTSKICFFGLDVDAVEEFLSDILGKGE